MRLHSIRCVRARFGTFILAARRWHRLALKRNETRLTTPRTRSLAPLLCTLSFVTRLTLLSEGGTTLFHGHDSRTHVSVANNRTHPTGGFFSLFQKPLNTYLEHTESTDAPLNCAQPDGFGAPLNTVKSDYLSHRTNRFQRWCCDGPNPTGLARSIIRVLPTGCGNRAGFVSVFFFSLVNNADVPAGRPGFLAGSCMLDVDTT